MANRDQYEYLNAFTAYQVGNSYVFRKRTFGGMLGIQFPDSDQCQKAENIDLSKLPYYISAHDKPKSVRSGYASPISIHAFDGFYIVVYKRSTKVYLDYVTPSATYTAELGNASTGEEPIRSIVQFNLYDDPYDPAGGEFVKKLIIYPDKKTMDYEIKANFTVADLDVDINYTPDLKYATVFQSRVFGVDNDRIYASAYNDYSNWDLDTADEQLAQNAWMTTAQSNSKAGSDFVGVTVYDDTVIAFKKGFMHEVTNNKNPFRLIDVYHEGALDSRAIQEVDGRLLFASTNGVMQYTGGKPSCVSGGMELDFRGEKGISGAYGGNYYVYHEKSGKLYVFNVNTEQWGTLAIDSPPVCFSSDPDHLYMLAENGSVYLINSDDKANSSFNVVLSPTAYGNLQNKMMEKITVLADIPIGASLHVTLRRSNGESFNLLAYGSSENGEKLLAAMVNQSSGFHHTLEFDAEGDVKIKFIEVRYKYADEVYASI